MAGFASGAVTRPLDYIPEVEAETVRLIVMLARERDKELMAAAGKKF